MTKKIPLTPPLQKGEITSDPLGPPFKKEEIIPSALGRLNSSSPFVKGGGGDFTEVSIHQILQFAKITLANIDTADIDAQLLLMHVLNKPRQYLLTWPEKILTQEQQEQFYSLLQRRKQGEPIAYILGKKDFWNLSFKVTADVLIPRPETELIIEWILNLKGNEHHLKVADLGTGSGAIAISLAHERPNWHITATDFSAAALQIAQHNAQHYQLNNISFLQGSWCEALKEHEYDIIISNPPYIAKNDIHLSNGDVRFEPKQALIAENEGYQDLFTIALQAKDYLKNQGILILEHGFEQAERLAQYLQKIGYHNIKVLYDLAGHPRTTLAYLP